MVRGLRFNSPFLLLKKLIMQTKVLLYDDNETLGQSLQLMIEEEDDMQVIAVMPNAETVVQDIELLKPNVVLMDIDMPNVNGVEAVKQIRKVNEQLPVIMLTVFEDNDNIFNAVCAGASGYILKRSASAEIPDAIRNVLTGGAPMTGSVARKVLLMVPAKENKKEEFNLSAHETNVLQLLVKGYSYKMIAAELCIAIDTVRFHIKKIYDKLHVHSATEAVSKALQNKIV
jgi:DNA-binding NarL/FixJ family response regulator